MALESNGMNSLKKLNNAGFKSLVYVDHWGKLD